MQTPPDDGVPWVSAHLTGDGFRTKVVARSHPLIADEPAAVGGDDAGPTPYELLLGAVGACTAMTVRMYATRKQWPLEGVTVRLRPVQPHAADCERCETEEVGPGRLERVLEFTGPLTEEQRARLTWIADRCPVKQTLGRGLTVEPAVTARISP